MNIRIGADTFFNAASFTSLDSAGADPVPCSGDPIEPGGRDKGKTPPTGLSSSAEYSLLFADCFERPAKKGVP
ncbi:MAG TPA: hypothetical protein VIG99_21460 [Myxococcaceae bacterium]|jgi:hypothetical protein